MEIGVTSSPTYRPPEITLKMYMYNIDAFLDSLFHLRIRSSSVGQAMADNSLDLSGECSLIGESAMTSYCPARNSQDSVASSSLTAEQYTVYR